VKLVRILLAVLAALGAGEETARAQGELTLEQFARKNIGSIVKLRVSGKDAMDEPAELRIGTGGLVHPAGWVLTAAHCVGADREWKAGDDGRPVRKVRAFVLDASGVERPIPFLNVAYVDEDHDVALLRLAGTAHLSYAIRQAPAIVAGQEVFALGWGARTTPEPVRGTVLTPADAGNDHFVKLNIDLQPGDSGGLVVDKLGRFIGLIVEGRTDLPAAIYVTNSLPDHPTRVRIPDGAVAVKFETNSRTLVDENAIVELTPVGGGPPTQARFFDETSLLPETYAAVPVIDRQTGLRPRNVVVEDHDQGEVQRVEFNYDVTVFGYVRDGRGRPRSGVALRFGDRTVTSADDGAFRLDDLPLLDQYPLDVYAHGVATSDSARPHRETVFNFELALAKDHNVRLP
jgi:Trypsin-like peptidase domain